MSEAALSPKSLSQAPSSQSHVKSLGLQLARDMEMWEGCGAPLVWHREHVPGSEGGWLCAPGSLDQTTEVTEATLAERGI